MEFISQDYTLLEFSLNHDTIKYINHYMAYMYLSLNIVLIYWFGQKVLNN
jgi:hypothetical protein